MSTANARSMVENERHGSRSEQIPAQLAGIGISTELTTGEESGNSHYDYYHAPNYAITLDMQMFEHTSSIVYWVCL